MRPLVATALALFVVGMMVGVADAVVYGGSWLRPAVLLVGFLVGLRVGEERGRIIGSDESRGAFDAKLARIEQRLGELSGRNEELLRTNRTLQQKIRVLHDQEWRNGHFYG